MKLLSKELLSKVLGHSEVVDELEVSTVYSNMELGIRYVKHYETYTLVDCINIYELAHKCKEWAFNENYIISSELHFHSACVAIYNNNGLVLGNNNNDCIIESTEPEAVFKATQWIYDNRGEK